MSVENIYGWVPNIRGNVCNPANIKSKIDEASLSYPKRENTSVLNIFCEYEYDISGNKIVVSNDLCGTVEINILHEGGLCSLNITKNKIKNDKGTKVWIAEVWRGFREMIDGCSDTVCDCTAMVPIYLNPGESLYEKIAEVFIETIEHETDFANRIVGRIIREKNTKTTSGWETLWNKSRNLQNVSNANQLYFRRFLDIYRNEFTPQRVDELNRMMNAWCDKAKIAYDDNMRESEFGFKKASDRLNRRRFYIAAASLIIAVLAIVLF
ncbi:hypothetical protein Mpt1_c13490 [Candidatus Methanoplasma termitum]|uniref:Uncharacterized protein n=1 Tax=Candidatus Methanoplasma termitum TaxID=1577791 RepID=A0A0A7LDG5_9ARCH|nr:hypothetical protein [Candidatus Methanoplasma termitum]AIZ57210.1 hypothetical protein Mpt1_c13490 [Candidatus Methanoplasma termitum]MCL2333965.1 hypothetical protein [Candidatus Methanoplasma sp.]